MKKHLLLIDNDRHLNTVNRKVLRSSGIVNDLHIVNNGQDGLDYLKFQTANKAPLPNIIVFELQIPVVNGFDFIDQFAMLEIPAKDNIELVVFTSSSKHSDKQKAISKGIRHYLTKPYLLNGLREIISQLYFKPSYAKRKVEMGFKTIL
jgi:CheY-like chemotaxis protein